MKETNHEPMDASKQFCPNLACSTRGQIGQGNIRIHDRKRQRYRCRSCGHTFSARHGTMLEGLRKPSELIILIVTLLAYGCPIQAIVHAFGLDERTVASWQKRAGVQCQRVHAAVVEQGKVRSQHLQADEIRAKGRKLVIWIALAMDVTTRLWLAGVVSQQRDRKLIDQLFEHVRVGLCAMSRITVSPAQLGGTRRKRSWVIQSTLIRKVKGKIAYWKRHRELTDDRVRGWQDPCGMNKARLPEAQLTVVKHGAYGKASEAHTLLCNGLQVRPLQSPEKWTMTNEVIEANE